MHNDLFSIGPVTIHGYGLMIAIGVLAAIIISDRRCAKRGLKADHIYSLVVWMIVLGFLTAKILFIITYFKDFLADPRAFLKTSGFVVFGGLIGGMLTLYGYCRIKKISFVDYIDLIVPSVALAQGFGRIGCLLAGCCYGRPTDSAIGIVFTHSDFAPNNIKLLPTQIMMSIGDFIIAAILFILAVKLEKRIQQKSGSDTYPSSTGGRLTLIYFILYSLGRFFVEYYRADYRGSVGPFSTSQFIGLLVIAASIVMYYLFFIRNKNTAKGEKDE
ncbi:MAG: prolipoprotein diacylglyceryl transferase [Lachnospiraceae bacterium]|nr:prolipoprotein diacylglyceryl transferase [Lachnospiraceae bacterium]